MMYDSKQCINIYLLSNKNIKQYYMKHIKIQQE